MSSVTRMNAQRWASPALAAGMFQVVIGSTLPSGLYALYEASWNLSRSATTTIFAMYVAGVLISLLWLGHLADRFGRKRIILLTIALSMLSSSLFLIATNTVFLYAARLLSGLSVGICTGAFTSALGDVSGTKRGAAISAITTSSALAMGPVASAVVAHYLPFKLQLPFVIHLVLLTAAGIPLLKLTETAPSTATHRTEPGARRLFPSRSSAIIFIVCTTAIGWAYGANGLWQSVVPLTAEARGYSQMYIAVLASAMLGTSALAQITTLSLPPRRTVLTGLALLGFGLIASGAAISAESLAYLWLATIVVGVGQGLSFRGSLSIAAEMASEQRQATAISLYYVFGYVMTAVAPLLTNAVPIWGVLATMGALSIASLIVMYKKTKGV